LGTVLGYCWSIFFLFLLKTGLQDFILGTLGDALSDLPFFYSIEN